MKFALMCCNCNAFLGKDGQVIIPRGTGVMFKGKMIQIPDVSMSDKLAVFSSEAEADTAARAAGWECVTVPQLGSVIDHRCPSCLGVELEGRSAGAYVPVDLVVAR